MKIVSPFKDYYDVVLANDRDPYPLYLRQPAEYEFKDREHTYYRIQRWEFPRIPGISHEKSTGCVAFCGRLYPFWFVQDTICYTLQQVVAAFKKRIDLYDGSPEYRMMTKGYHETLSALSGTKVNRPSYGGGWGTLNEPTWQAWQEHMKEGGRISDSVFLKEQAPVIAVFGTQVLINPILRKLNFHTVLDPFTAYQEISMFLGNNLAQQVDPIPKTTDELKAHAHGFDKWSFRTHKEDSKKTKRRNKAITTPAPKEEKEIILDDSDFT